ncbi:ribonuclease E/G [Brevundimonas sp. BR2-1]|uniref:ribonuclease E/G n=1 Tax=Brevundimonas sp. BR2-1 TaxID=3031123 RepID=UPI0030AB97FB
MSVEVFLDDTPGELRAVIRRDGHFEHLLIESERDDPQTRLGARSVARVRRAAPGLKGAFVDLGAGGEAFMSLRGGGVAAPVGSKIEVELVAEHRAGKAPAVRWIGPAEGEPRLLTPAPTLTEALARLAPGVTPVTGKAAIEAGWQAVEESQTHPAIPGGTVAVERTRAMVTVDIDLNSHDMGRARERDAANRRGLLEAARAIRLRRWAGLVAIDLIGAGHDGAAILKVAKAAFGDDPRIAYGPVNRFGVLQLALPWERTPLEEVLYRYPSIRAFGAGQAAQEVTRRIKFELLSDTTRARITARCPAEVARLAAPLVAQLGPRAHLRADDSLPTGEHVIEAE